MAALTGARSTPMPSGGDPTPKAFSVGLAANKKVFAGGIVVLNPANGGYAEAASTALGLIVLGRAENPPFGSLPAVVAPGVGANYYDNTGGANGGITVTYRQGVFTYANSAGGDLIAATNIGADCYLVDDQTVALTDGSVTRSRAGVIVGVDAQGNVQVQIGAAFAGAKVAQVVTLPMTLSALPVGAAVQAFPAFTPSFAGRIKSIAAQIQVAGAGAGAAISLTPRIAGTPVTGGVVALTLANTVANATLAGTAVTALNAFTPAQAIDLATVGAGTVFTAGSGWITLVLG
jgi:hypothetical protein